jgi:hypothetical protein
MKKAKSKRARARTGRRAEMLPEYDFSRGRPNKYAQRYAKNTIVVTLDPDVAAVFPGACQVNEALRNLLAEVEKAARDEGLAFRGLKKATGNQASVYGGTAIRDEDASWTNRHGETGPLVRL